ncbi:hypothetical protein [Bdellovibrio sp. KM01]|uniref:hypothetical protein n=1 Tax=Bdellovibrio sp. KM01 TaxID=2748865 RepID=UPI0015EACD64|nr:hypothetical protein [Bdellovibrio sp. KM01]QLY25899.1 hypothetical protein HW988_02335 [Bdellovibrio sp. KM01]
MKKLIAAALILAGSTAFADSTVLKCSAPSKGKAATINVTLGDDTSVDFLTMEVSEKTGSSTFFAQLDKGTVANQLKQGYLQMLALTEKSAQTEDGVIRNTGFFGVSSDNKGASFSGFMAANGNIYPVSCTK